MWIDTNNCEQTMHIFSVVDGKVVCLHSDDTECTEAEYDAKELKEAA